MKKVLKRIGICLLLTAGIWTWSVITDRVKLREELIRLHVVAASDSGEDQTLKLMVRDAVVESLTEEMKNLTDTTEAMEYLQRILPQIENLAARVLRQAGCNDAVKVQLGLESFSQRIYDTFTLPAGVYRSLRIVIGEGAGQNWWCVAYPSLCLPTTSEGFEEAAQCAGFSETMTAVLEGREGYEIRFFLLELLGKLENLLYRG